MLRIKLFGSGKLFDGDDELRLPSRAWTLPLLGYLVLHRGERIARTRLAFTLWPDEPQDVALHNLRRKLHLLVKALPPTTDGAVRIVADSDTIAWNDAVACDLDVARFEDLRGNDASLPQALDLYEGDLLEDVYDDWIAAARERLRGLYLTDLGTSIVASRSRRAFAAAVDYAQRLLRADPWREDAIRHLIAARYESGDAAGALTEFDRFARALREEMNVEPMPDTLALRDAVARGQPVPGSTAPGQTVERPAASLAPFVGRKRELGRLHEEWLQAARANGALTIVRGEAGIGKSRLVAELGLVVEAQGGRVIAGSTSAPERDPYQCISTALRHALPLVAGIALPPPLLAALAELVPELRAHRTDVPALPRLDPSSERARLFDSLAQTFVALARPRPLLVILEDVHRAGAATIEALIALVPRLSRSAVLLVATQRDDDLTKSAPVRYLDLAAKTGAACAAIGPLDRSDVRLLVDALAPQSYASEDIVASVMQRSGGNPLFVTEMLRDVQLAGSLETVLPASLNAMLSARLASLSTATRIIAEVAAVAGEAFTVDVVREIAGLPEATLLDGLDELLDRHIVRESTETRYEYAFTHHLVHAAIYQGSPADTTARRHRRIARKLDASLVDVSGERAAEIAWHYERGGDAPSAAKQYAMAAQRAARLNANAEARDLVDRALSLDAGNDRERFALVVLRSRMNARLADFIAEGEDIVELERLAGGLDDDAVCAALELRIDLAFRSADHRAERDAIERLARHAHSVGSERWLAAAAVARAGRSHYDGDYARARENALEARDRYMRLGDLAASARAAAVAAKECAFSPGRISEARGLIEEALGLAERAADPEVRLLVVSYAEYVAQEQADWARQAEFARSALTLALEVGDRAAEARSRGALGVTCWDVWQIDESRSHFLEAIRIAESLGLRRISSLLCNLGAMLSEVGDFENAVLWLRRAKERALETDALENVATAVGHLAGTAWQRGDVAGLGEAVRELAAIVTRLPDSRFTAVAPLNEGRLLRCTREFAAAERAIVRAFDLFDRSGRSDEAADALSDLALTQLAAGRPGAARNALDRAGVLSSATSVNENWLIRLYWIEACVLHAGGDGEARNALLRARAVYAKCLGALRDPDLRSAFEAIPIHRAIDAALNRDEWPAPDSPCVVAFPGSTTSRRTKRAAPRPSEAAR